MRNPTSDEEKKSIDKIFEMLDLFYANKHMYDKLKARDEERSVV